MPVLQLTQDVLFVAARDIQPVSPVSSVGPVSDTIIIKPKFGLAVSPVAVGDGTIAIGANQRLLRAAAAEAQPEPIAVGSDVCTRVLLLCAGCDRVGSERGTARLRLSVVDKSFHHAQTAAGTETEALRADARGRLSAWERRVIQMVKSASGLLPGLNRNSIRDLRISIE